MSPEEYTLGAEIDEKTNVFNMGAAAFVFLGGEKDRNYNKWRCGKELYDVALKAVEPDRNKRYNSMEEYLKEWNKAEEIFLKDLK
jgi:serine/threonine-protein kinase